MPETQKSNQRSSARKKKNTSPATILIIIILLAAVLIWLIFFSGPKSDREQVTVPPGPVAGVETTEPSVGEAGPTSQDETPKGGQDQEGYLQTQRSGTAGISAEKPDIPAIKIQSCDQLAVNLSNFFEKIDKREYLEPFALDMASQEYFLNLASQLLDNPPIVVRESDDLFTILKNMAHFFRILGKDNILLIKTILDREAEQIEDIANELYQWTVNGSCTNETFPLKAPLDKMYEYAGFFINTMGGRSYLFRRDSRSRLIVNYYSILIIDKTNQENMNRYGIDINNSIKQLIREIETTTHLIYKEDYLDTLYGLMERYQAPEKFQ